MNNPRILAKSFIDFKKGNLYVLGGDAKNSCERFSYLITKKWELINVNLDEHLNSAEVKSFSSVLPNYTVHSNYEKKLPAKPLNHQKNKQKKNDFEEKKMALIKEENADLEEVDADYVSSEKDELFYLFGTDSEPYIIEFNNTKRISKIINANSPLQLQGYQGGVKTSKNCYFLAGGINSSLNKIHHAVYLFMGLENETLKLESMSTPRYTFNVVLQYPWVYILGGRTYGNDQEGILNSCERYNLEKQEWQSIAPLNFRRCTAMAFGWSNGVYIAGGYMGSLKREKRFECYLEDENKWEVMGIELLEPLEASSFLITESKLLFIGGRVYDGDTNKIWSYDVSNGFDAFYGDSVGIMKAKRCLHKSCQLNKDFILILGGDSYENSVEIFYYNKEKNMVNAKEEYLFDDIRKSLLKNIKKCFKESKLQKNLLL